MGRPRLHKTPEDAAAAARQSRGKYYQLNRKTIRLKSKAKYRSSISRPSDAPKDEEKRMDEDSSTHTVDKASVSSQYTTLSTCVQPGSTTPTSYPSVRPSLTVRELLRLQPSFTIKQQLTALVGDSMCSYMALLYSEVMVLDSDSAQSLVQAIISVAERIQLHARHKEDEILNANGLGARYRAANEASQLAQAVLSQLEDLLCSIMLGPDEVAEGATRSHPEIFMNRMGCFGGATRRSHPTLKILPPQPRKFSATKMSKWASPEQEAWLEAYFHEKYKPCMPSKNYTGFWPGLFKEWAQRWPERNACPELKDKPANEPLTDAENAILVAAVLKRKDQLTNKMRWFSGKGTRSRTLLSGQKTKALGTLSSFSKGTRAPQAREVFVKLETADKISYADTIRQRLDTRAEQEGLRGNRAALMKARQEITKQVYEEAGEDVKSVVESKKAELTQIMHEKKRATKLSKLPRTPDEIQNSIDGMPSTMANVLVDMHELTGWSYTLLAGGPQLSEGGTLKSLTIHVGENKVGKDFGSALVGFKDKIVRPFDMYLRTVYPANVCNGGASTSDTSGHKMDEPEGSQTAAGAFNSDLTHTDSGFGAGMLSTTLRDDASIGAPLLFPSVPSSVQQQTVASFNLSGPSVTSSNSSRPPSLMPMMPTGAFYRSNPEFDKAIPFDFDEFGNIRSTTPDPKPIKSISGYYSPSAPEVPFEFSELGDIISDDWSSSSSSPSSSLLPLPLPTQLPSTAPLLTSAIWPVPANAPGTASVPTVPPPSPDTGRLPLINIAETTNAAGPLSLAFVETSTARISPINIAEIRDAIASPSLAFVPVETRDTIAPSAPFSLPQTQTLTIEFAPPRLHRSMDNATSQSETALDKAANPAAQGLSLSTPPRLRHYTSPTEFRSHVNSNLQNSTTETPQTLDVTTAATTPITRVSRTATNRSLPDKENPVPDSQPEELDLGRSKRVRTASKRHEQDNAIGLTPPAKRSGAAIKKSARSAKRTKTG